MKKAFLLLAATAFLFSCSNDKGNWARYGLNGEVKSTSEYEYYATAVGDEWVPGETYTVTVESFDKNGNITGVETHTGGTASRRPVDNTEYNPEGYKKYDDQGRLEEDTKVNKISDTEIEYKTYDLEGNLKKEQHTFYENYQPLKSECKVIYSPGELVIQQLYKNYKGGEVDEFTIEYTYDKNSHLTELNQLGKSGEVRDFMKYTYVEYDAKKNWSKRLLYTPESGADPYKIIIREIEYY